MSVIQVPASEADLLAVARALAGQVAWEAVEPLVRAGRPLHPRTTAPALRLVEATLGRALVLALARRGGARVGRWLAGADKDPGPAGRLWQRHPSPSWRFSPASLQLLRWLTAAKLGSAYAGPELAADDLTPADQLMIVLALDGLERLGLAGVLAAQPLVRATPLAYLSHPARLAGATNVPSFASLSHGEGAMLVEALAPDLARRWLAVARGQRELTDPAALTRLGELEHTVLQSFMDAAAAAKRRDLALWIVDAGARLCARPLPVTTLVGGLDARASLGERSAARRAAGALLRALLRWGGWDAEHRAIGFVDDGHAAAQLLLAGFEALGDNLRHARDTLAELDGLAVAGGPT